LSGHIATPRRTNGVSIFGHQGKAVNSSAINRVLTRSGSGNSQRLNATSERPLAFRFAVQGTKVAVIEGAGHSPMAEAPAKTLQLIENLSK